MLRRRPRSRAPDVTVNLPPDFTRMLENFARAGTPVVILLSEQRGGNRWTPLLCIHIGVQDTPERIMPPRFPPGSRAFVKELRLDGAPGRKVAQIQDTGVMPEIMITGLPRNGSVRTRCPPDDRFLTVPHLPLIFISGNLLPSLGVRQLPSVQVQEPPAGPGQRPGAPFRPPPPGQEPRRPQGPAQAEQPTQDQREQDAPSSPPPQPSSPPPPSSSPARGRAEQQPGLRRGFLISKGSSAEEEKSQTPSAEQKSEAPPAEQKSEAPPAEQMPAAAPAEQTLAAAATEEEPEGLSTAQEEEGVSAAQGELEGAPSAEIVPEGFSTAEEVPEGFPAEATAVAGAAPDSAAAAARPDAGVSALQEEWNCPICLCPFDAPVSTPCNHTFCRGCVEGLLRSELANARQRRQAAPAALPCPICRTNLFSEGQSVRVTRNAALEAQMSRARIVCEACDAAPFSPLQHKAHNKVCGGIVAQCPHMALGCAHRCARREMRAHLESCAYEQIKGLYPKVFGNLQRLYQQMQQLSAQVRSVTQVADATRTITREVAAPVPGSPGMLVDMVLRLCFQPQRWARYQAQHMALEMPHAVFHAAFLLFLLPVVIIAVQSLGSAPATAPLVPGIGGLYPRLRDLGLEQANLHALQGGADHRRLWPTYEVAPMDPDRLLHVDSLLPMDTINGAVASMSLASLKHGFAGAPDAAAGEGGGGEGAAPDFRVADFLSALKGINSERAITALANEGYWVLGSCGATFPEGGAFPWPFWPRAADLFDGLPCMAVHPVLNLVLVATCLLSAGVFLVRRTDKLDRIFERLIRRCSDFLPIGGEAAIAGSGGSSGSSGSGSGADSSSDSNGRTNGGGGSSSSNGNSGNNGNSGISISSNSSSSSSSSSNNNNNNNNNISNDNSSSSSNNNDNSNNNSSNSSNGSSDSATTHVHPRPRVTAEAQAKDMTTAFLLQAEFVCSACFGALLFSLRLRFLRNTSTAYAFPAPSDGLTLESLLPLAHVPVRYVAALTATVVALSLPMALGHADCSRALNRRAESRASQDHPMLRPLVDGVVMAAGAGVTGSFLDPLTLRVAALAVAFASACYQIDAKKVPRQRIRAGGSLPEAAVRLLSDAHVMVRVATVAAAMLVVVRYVVKFPSVSFCAVVMLVTANVCNAYLSVVKKLVELAVRGSQQQKQDYHLFPAIIFASWCVGVAFLLVGTGSDFWGVPKLTAEERVHMAMLLQQPHAAEA